MSASPELRWVAHMRKYIGQREIKGPQHNKVIMSHIADAFIAAKQKQWIFDDETAYCGSFLGGVYAKTGLGSKIPKMFPRAKEWAKAGYSLKTPAYGCVVVFSRKGGGHVGICVGKTSTGLLKILGANQSDEINITDFPTSDVIAYRWIGDGPNPAQHRFDLPILPAGKIRTNLA